MMDFQPGGPPQARRTSAALEGAAKNTAGNAAESRVKRMVAGKHLAVVAIAAVVGLAAADAWARPGGGGSSGSRGGRTYSAPAPTQSAPHSAAPIERSVTPQSQPGFGQSGGLAQNAGRAGGFMSGGFGRGFMGGLLGAGLFGLLMGNGFGGGLGGMMSIIGLVLQVGLLFLIARFALNYFRNRQAQPAGGAPARAPMEPMGAARTSAAPLGGASAAPPLAIGPDDYQTFEQRLGQVQTAYSDDDVGALRQVTTPEMASYFEGELADNRTRGVHNKIGGVRLARGDLSESWREPNADYATVSMRYTLTDAMVDRTTGRIVSGSTTTPEEVAEYWTFTRPSGAGAATWRLSAIQQAR